MERTDGGHRQERLSARSVEGSHNALWEWHRHRHPLRVVVNVLVICFCRLCPSMRLKNRLYRAIGMEVGSRVGWGFDATPDLLWPDKITIHDDVIIGYDATLLCHEFLADECRTGPVVIGSGAMVGAGVVVLPGVRIGENARIAANSLVADDVPPDTTVAGVPATPRDEAGEASSG